MYGTASDGGRFWEDSSPSSSVSPAFGNKQRAQNNSWLHAALLDDDQTHSPSPLSGKQYTSLERVEERIVKSAPRELLLGSAKVDVRGRKAVHVTAQCRHGCGATHCSLGAVLPIGQSPATSPAHSHYSNNTNTPSPISIAATQDTISFLDSPSPAPQQPRKRLSIDLSGLDEILESVEVMQEQKTSAQWQSSFQSRRDKFGQRITQSQSTLSTWSTKSPLPNGDSANVQSEYGSLSRSSDSDSYRNYVSKSRSMYDVMETTSDTGGKFSNYYSPLTNGSGQYNTSATSDSDYSSASMRSATYINGLDNVNGSVDEHCSRTLQATATLPRWRQKLAERQLQTGARPAVSIQANIGEQHDRRSNTIAVDLTDLEQAVAGISRSAGSQPRFPLASSPIYHHKSRVNGYGQNSSSAGYGASTMPATSHSPSPDSIHSDGTTGSGGGPAGLPQPRPKHHLREQLISIGLEPRSPTVAKPLSGTLWNFPVPTTGTVAAKIQEIEKRPSTPPYLFPAGANGAGTAPLSTQTKGFQPTVYRTKPVIHLNVAKSTAPLHTASNIDQVSGRLILRYVTQICMMRRIQFSIYQFFVFIESLHSLWLNITSLVYFTAVDLLVQSYYYYFLAEALIFLVPDSTKSNRRNFLKILNR